jgi:hypothetical protein
MLDFWGKDTKGGFYCEHEKSSPYAAYLNNYGAYEESYPYAAYLNNYGVYEESIAAQAVANLALEAYYYWCALEDMNRM